MMTTFLPNLLAIAEQGIWMPKGVSTVSSQVDWLFYFIFYISVFFTLLITTLMVLFAVKYRHRGQEKPAPAHAAHSTTLEVTWTVIPTIIVLLIFYHGFRGYLNMAVEPANAYEVQVSAYAWGWNFTYPNGVVSPELHLPKDVPVLLMLNSQDVIHSLYLPQFRVKKDAVPGRVNRFWVQSTEVGEYDLFCTEYCGTNHSKMITKAIVHDVTDFNKWLDSMSRWDDKMTPVEAGLMLAGRFGCFQCHSVDGTAMTGPTWKNLYGSQRNFADGGSTVADENYIMESIKYPARHVIAGYANVMPSYLGQIKDPDIMAIIAYMKSISENFKQDPNVYPGSPVQAGAQPSTAPATPQ